MKAQQISFKPLLDADLPLLHRWLNTPHVSQWWSLNGSHHPSLEEVERKYSPRIDNKEPVDCYLICHEEKPIGMIQSCDLDNYPAEKAAFGLEGECVGIDLCIGEEDYVHKGLGPNIIRRFLEDIIFQKDDVDECIVDPDPANEIAIKAYKKAGFRFLRKVWYEAERQVEDLYIIRRGEVINAKNG